MDIRKVEIICPHCKNKHLIEVDYDSLTPEQISGRAPFNDKFICPDIAIMYRVMNFAIDSRSNSLKAPFLREDTIKGLLFEWGVKDFDKKLARFSNLDHNLLGTPDEYYNLLNSIISSYSCGYYYPAMTSAGALGERILNQLIIKTRNYFKSSKHYKKIYSKQSFDKWDLPIKILNDWKVISDDVKVLFLKLKKFRNDSIHYNNDYDFEKNSHEAVKTLVEIINLLFNYMQRKDLFWVFDKPGEILVRSDVLDNPFVKEFILPHCIQVDVNRGRDTKHLLLKPYTDEDFIRLSQN